MLSLPPAVRIFVATAPTNMHLSFDRKCSRFPTPAVIAA